MSKSHIYMDLASRVLFQLKRKVALQALQNLVKHVSTLRTSDNIIVSPYSNVTIPVLTLPELLWERASLWPNHIAVECSVTGRTFTYAELTAASRRLANSLLRKGFKKGDTLAVLLSNVVEYPVIILGVLDAGLTLTPLHPQSTADEISRQVEKSQASCLITSPTFLNRIEQKLKQSVHIICVPETDTQSQFEGVNHFGDILKVSDTTFLNRQHHEQDLNRTTLLMYSSGTTGMPKGVMLSQRNLVFQTLSHSLPEINCVPESTETEQATVPCIPPLSTIAALGCIMTRTFYNGAKLLMVPTFRPELFLPMLEQNKNVVLHIVPMLANFLASSDIVTENLLKNLICTIIAGAKPDTNDIERLLRKKFHKVGIGYGMTEASPGLTHTRVGDTNYASAGFVVSNTTAKIIDPETKETKDPGESGELCFKGPQVTSGYFKQPEATKEIIDENGWLHTGDEGYFDESGRCYITDRIKDLIKVKGFQVAPAELEYVLKQHPSVYEACVTSVPDSRTGEQPVAFVILTNTNQNTTKADDIKEFVNGKVAPHKRLLTVVVVDSIPKTTSGKLMRRELRKLL